jgi:hypothetical protein
MRMNLTTSAIAALLLALAANASAADSPCGDFSADRPGFSTDTAVLARGCQQLEWGYQFSRDDGTSDSTLPLLLVRVGIGNALELRAGWDGVSFMRTDGVSSHAANDPTLGAKLRLKDGDGLKLSLLAQVTLPVGSTSASSGGVDPSAALLWSHDLSENTTLSGAFTLASISNPGAGRNLQSALAVDIGRDFGHGFGGFLEYAGSDQDGAGFTQTLDGGLTWLIAGKLQLDVNAGFGLNRRAGDSFVGFGAAWRF